MLSIFFWSNLACFSTSLNNEAICEKNHVITQAHAKLKDYRIRFEAGILELPCELKEKVLLLHANYLAQQKSLTPAELNIITRVAFIYRNTNAETTDLLDCLDKNQHLLIWADSLPTNNFPRTFVTALLKKRMRIASQFIMYWPALGPYPIGNRPI